MEKHNGSIPAIAILKMIEQDALCLHDTSFYKWCVEIIPDHSHELIMNLPKDTFKVWNVNVLVNKYQYTTREARYKFVYNEANEAWAEYWKSKIIIDHNFVLTGAL
jgi:hypothetical protein